MWQAEAPEESEELRQGDLLKALVLPKPKLPLSFIITPGNEPRQGDRVVIETVQKDFLVVSQCCTIENSSFVALAPISSTRPLTEEQRRAYEALEPPIAPQNREDAQGTDPVGYVFNGHRLDPIPGILEAGKDQFKIADLTQIMSFGGDRQVLKRHRVARMNPLGRKALRIRLSYFWGRAEAEDLKWFAAPGVEASSR
jgi:hypothetical protein